MTNRLQLRDRLLRVVDQFAGRKLAVVGDLIADQFLYGQTARVSREAPVLVLQYRDLVRVPGGAANAANNLLDLDCRVTVFGAVGRDSAGRDLVSSLERKGADVRYIAAFDSYSTPIKTRILAGAHHSAPHQIVRVDRESRLDSQLRLPWGRMGRSLRKMHGIIVSDYGYGMVVPSSVHELKRIGRQEDIPLVVDSRFRMAEFHGVTSMTPNITELEASTGISIGADQQLLNTDRPPGDPQTGSCVPAGHPGPLRHDLAAAAPQVRPYSDLRHRRSRRCYRSRRHCDCRLHAGAGLRRSGGGGGTARQLCGGHRRYEEGHSHRESRGIVLRNQAGPLGMSARLRAHPRVVVLTPAAEM